MIGETFGRLTVIDLAGIGENKHRRWECRCRCGNMTEAAGNELRRGRVQSCGCIRREHGQAVIAGARAKRRGVPA